MDELKPCPFCGGTKIVLAHSQYNRHEATCAACRAVGGHVYIEEDSHEEISKRYGQLSDQWNRRALQAQPTAERAELVKRLRYAAYADGYIPLLAEAADALENAAGQEMGSEKSRAARVCESIETSAVPVAAAPATSLPPIPLTAEHYVYRSDYDALRQHAEALTEKLRAAERGEYICKQCGLRKEDGEHEPITF